MGTRQMKPPEPSSAREWRIYIERAIGTPSTLVAKGAIAKIHPASPLEAVQVQHGRLVTPSDNLQSFWLSIFFKKRMNDSTSTKAKSNK